MLKVKFLGLPGSGKSTLFEDMKKSKTKKYTFSVSRDHLVRGKDLEHLSENMKQNAVTFQSLLVEKFSQLSTETPRSNIVMEHTPIEMVEFFNLAYTAYNYMTEYNLDHLRHKIEDAKRLEKDTSSVLGYVYIFAPVNRCIKNMKKRGRLNEPEYDKMLFRHINMMMKYHCDNNPLPKLMISYEHGISPSTDVKKFLTRLLTEADSKCCGKD